MKFMWKENRPSRQLHIKEITWDFLRQNFKRGNLVLAQPDPSFRLRYYYASRPVSFGDSSINGAYPINYTDKTNALKYHCVGAELLFGKRFFFINEGRLYLDLGVGGSYNHTLVTNMDIMYKTDELPTFWTKIILQLGYKF